MPFGVKNSPATFQRLVNSLTFNLVGCKAYIDDAIIFSEEWEGHLQTIRNFFDRLSEATLTVNLTKSEFCHANLTFLGHMVGQGQVKAVEAKVEAIADFPVPSGKRQLMRFLEMAGYYRKFCNNFSVMAEPLTNLLGKRVKFIWTDNCQKSFDKLKAILKSAPVLLAPSFDKEFKLAIDASDVGAGSVLLQEDDNGVDHPVCYYSKKFNKHQRNYSTVEKECLSLILALQHFEVYLASSVAPIVIFTDHNPLMPGRVAQSVTCLATDACLTADPGVASSIPVRSHAFVEFDHEMISMVILLPSADSFKKGCCQLQAKVCARITG